jgi:hypothetical protein
VPAALPETRAAEQPQARELVAPGAATSTAGTASLAGRVIDGDGLLCTKLNDSLWPSVMPSGATTMS